MRKIALIFLVLIASGCNLSVGRPTPPIPPVETDAVKETTAPIIEPTGLPTLPPPPGAVNSNSSTTGGSCAVYLTYSGNNPDNKLSLRAEPSTRSVQLLKLPNNAEVFVPSGWQEIEADGYHWLNVIYIDAQNRYQGWAARDSFEFNGVRDPTIATLRVTGQQTPC